MKKLCMIISVATMLMCELAIFIINVIPKSFTLEDNFAYTDVLYSEQLDHETLLENYNNLLDKNNLPSLNLMYLTLVDETYYLGLYQDLILFITSNEAGYVCQSGIIYLEDSSNIDIALNYYKYLIEANNNDKNTLYNDYFLKSVMNDNLVFDNGLNLVAIKSDGEVNLVIERVYPE